VGCAIVWTLIPVVSLGACASGQSELPAPSVQGTSATLSSAAAAVFVGERTSLTALFDGDDAAIDGIGSVQSGVAVETPPLSRTTTFTLRVSRGQNQVQAQTTVRAIYRNRIRVLAAAPIAQTNHVAAALPDGRAIVRGDNTSATPLVPDSTLTQVFDPGTESFASGSDLIFSALAQLFTCITPLVTGAAPAATCRWRATPTPQWR
jgi:hypothetical protein